MDARSDWTARRTIAIALARLAIVSPLLAGASFRRTNFVGRCTDAGDRPARRANVLRNVESRSRKPGSDASYRRGRAPCPVRVVITQGEAGGLTSFGFHQGRVTDQRMTVEGRLDRILASALPHEVTHTIFASYFGGPMPRWADEGASLLSEDNRELRRGTIEIVVDLLGAARRDSAFSVVRHRGLSQGPDELLRTGLLDLAVPGRDGRKAQVSPIRPGRPERRVGHLNSRSLRAQQSSASSIARGNRGIASRPPSAELARATRSPRSLNRERVVLR